MVICGPPPSDGNEYRGHWPELPPWPVWAQGYGKVETQAPCIASLGDVAFELHPGVCDAGCIPDKKPLDAGWSPDMAKMIADVRRECGLPDPEGGSGNLTAAEARAYWLEKEVKAMREALADMQKSNLKSAYWANVLNGTAMGGGQPSRGAAGGLGLYGGDRASTHRVYGGDRAGNHGEFGGDRAGATVNLAVIGLALR